MITKDEATFMTDEELSAAHHDAMETLLTVVYEQARRRLPVITISDDQRDLEEYIEEMSLGGRTHKEQR